MEIRPIDAESFREWWLENGENEFVYDTNAILDSIDSWPTLTLSGKWVSVEDRLPELPDEDYCDVMVITYNKGDAQSMVMIYDRALVRGKRVERWKYYWDRIADETPDYWMHLPAPPKED